MLDASLQRVFLTLWTVFPQAAEGAPAGGNFRVLPGDYQAVGLWMGWGAFAGLLSRTSFEGFRAQILHPPGSGRVGAPGEKLGR